MQQDSNLFTGMKYDFHLRNIIKQIASWAMIIVTVNVIGYILSLIAVFTGNEATLRGAEAEGFTANMLENAGSSKGFIIVSIVIGLVINFFLFRFGTFANASVKSGSTKDLGNAFRHMKSYFAITSVIMILILVFIVIVIVAASLS